MNKGGRGKIVIIMILCLLVFLVVFYFVANGERHDDLEKLSATQATIQRDLSINYPQTPKAVVRYYAELSQCMYDPANTDEEIEAIAVQSRMLFDDELKAQQSDKEYLASLKTAIAGFLKDNRKIVSFTVSPSSEVMYSTLDIGEIASLYCNYTMQKNSVSYTDAEHFLLRKDDKGRWKILGWQSAEKDNVNAGTVNSGSKEDTEEAEEEVKEEAPNGEAPGQETKNNVVIPKPEIPTVEKPTVEIEIPGVKK